MDSYKDFLVLLQCHSVSGFEVMKAETCSHLGTFLLQENGQMSLGPRCEMKGIGYLVGAAACL